MFGKTPRMMHVLAMHMLSRAEANLSTLAMKLQTNSCRRQWHLTGRMPATTLRFVATPAASGGKNAGHCGH